MHLQKELEPNPKNPAVKKAQGVVKKMQNQRRQPRDGRLMDTNSPELLLLKVLLPAHLFS